MMPASVLRDVRVFDGRQLGDPTTVVLDGAVIGSVGGDVPPGAREVDGAGATLLPGLIDAHVHIGDPRDLGTLASWGVTTGLDMACWPAERVAAIRTSVGGADFRTAGLPAIGGGGAHACMPGMPDVAVIDTPDDARRHVEARVAEGADYIKGVAEAPGDGGPSAEALAALVAAAREHGLLTVVHAASVGAFALAVASGAEIITHVPVVGQVRPEDAAAMKAAGQVAVPTLTMIEGIRAGRLGSTDITTVLASLTTLHEAGVEIVAGTDANAGQGSPSEVAHGESLHHELELMVRAGMSPADVLRSATVAPATVFGLTDRGAIAPGLRADLLLVDGDPTVAIEATRRIQGVWCAGQQVV
jgi:imidazolonepropionase-like amidohydrolase